MQFNHAVNLLLLVASVSAQSDPCQECSVPSTSLQTLLTSPNYPRGYPPRTCCRYLVLSPSRCPTAFHVQFLDFSLELSPNCTNDFLAVGEDEPVTLCGHVIGARKFRAPNGVLHLRFVTNDNAIEDRGFRLLITRMLCEETTTSNLTEKADIKTFRSPTKQTNNLQQDVFRSEQGYLPCQGNNYRPQDVNYPQQLPTGGSCCGSNFRQPRFYLASSEFPMRADASWPRDCFHYIEKAAPSVCGLRVVFRFFALGGVDANSGQCLSDFIEIDGERMCGCRTGFVYTADWGLGAKAIRVKTNGRLSGVPSVGFLLDVIQETCVMRYTRQVEPGRLIPHAIVETNTTTRTGVYFLKEQRNFGMDERLFFPQANRCEFGFADLLRLSFDPLWVTRPRC